MKRVGTIMQLGARYWHSRKNVTNYLLLAWPVTVLAAMNMWRCVQTRKSHENVHIVTLPQSHLTSIFSTDNDCPDQHQKSLYATLRNILNTASHTANATSDARPTLYTPDGNADEYDGHSLDNSLCDSSHVSEFNKVAKLSAILKGKLNNCGN